MRVLIADSDPSEHLLMAMAADDWALDREISFAATTPQLVEMLRCELPDVVVLDLRLEGVNSFAPLALLQRTGLLYKVPVVVIADRLRRAEHRSCLQLGAVHVEQRPVELLERASLLDRLAIAVEMDRLSRSEVPSLDVLYAAMADDLMHEIEDSLGNTPPA